MPELERYILHKLHDLHGTVTKAYGDYDFKRVFNALINFMNVRSLGLLSRYPQGLALLRSLRHRIAAAPAAP